MLVAVDDGEGDEGASEGPWEEAGFAEGRVAVVGATSKSSYMGFLACACWGQSTARCT